MSIRYEDGVRPGKVVAWVLGGVGVLLLILIFFGSFYTVDAGERGVRLSNGAITGIEEPGLGFKLPFLQSVVMIPVAQRTTRWQAGTEAPALATYSFDQQVADITLSVTCHEAGLRPLHSGDGDPGARAPPGGDC